MRHRNPGYPALRARADAGRGRGANKKGILKLRNKAGMSFGINAGFGTNPFWGTFYACCEASQIASRGKDRRGLGKDPSPVPPCGTPSRLGEGHKILMALAHKQPLTPPRRAESLSPGRGTKTFLEGEKSKNAQKWHFRRNEAKNLPRINNIAKKRSQIEANLARIRSQQVVENRQGLRERTHS